MNSRLSIPAVVAFAVMQFGITVTIRAQCSVSANPSYDAPNNTLVVSASVGAMCSAPGVAISVEGASFTYSERCATNAGCTITHAFDTSCFAPGAHTVTATADCNQGSGTSCASRPAVQSSSAFTVPDATPEASISIEQISPARIRIHMPYKFTDTAYPSQRSLKLEHFLPNGAPDTSYWVTGADTSTGEWTFPPNDWDITCWLPGAHRFVFTATACGRYVKQTETPFAMPDEKPTLSTSVVDVSTNSERVDLAWTFRATVGQRSVTLHHFFPNGTEDGTSWFYPTDRDTASQTFDTTCWPNGTHVFKAFAVACDRTTTESDQSLVIDHRPHLDLSVQPTGGGSDGSKKKALLSYRFSADNPAGRSITVEFLPEFPATVPIQVRAPFTPDSTTPNPLPFDVPDFGAKGILRARASNSCGETAVADASVDCDCQTNEGPKTVPHPVRLWDGSMTYTERDPLPSDGFPLFVREYDTLNTQDGLFGVGWHSVFEAGLVHFMDGSIDTVTIRTEGERRAAFTKMGGVWTQSWPTGVGAAATLTSDASGWRYREGGSSLVRIYRVDGRFGGFDDLASSKKVLIDYNASGQPLRVYTVDGTWSCSIVMVGNHIGSIAVDGQPDLTWQYDYLGSALRSVTLASSSSPPWRTYEYSGGLLSLVRDAAGALIESHSYDAQGRAIDSIGGSTTDITSITYGTAGTPPDSTLTQVTYATGEVTSFEQRYVRGRQQTIATVGGCGSCGSRNMTYAIDPTTGSVARNQDARGYISSFTYDALGRLIQERRNDRPATCDPEQDPAHCRMSATALLTAPLQSTSASTFVGYSYGDPLWPDKPTTITTPSVVQSGDTRIDTITYDPLTGTAVSRTSNGWTVDATGHTVRVDQATTVVLYDGTATAAFNPGRNFVSSWLTLPQPSGQKKSIDGPRTDVADVTLFVYYPVDASVAATNRGRLAAIQNALGHVTTFENYDVFGNAGRVVDANGVATESTFDALGRVRTTTLKPSCGSSSDPGCGTDIVTTNSYAPSTGPLGSRTDAIGNVTTYEYDERGRLLALSRGASATALSERIEYTYDAATGGKASERFLSSSPVGSGDRSAFTETHREWFAYDTLAQLTAQTHADLTSIVYTYDDAGSLASVRDEDHATANTRYSYDPARRLWAVRQTLGGGQATTSYAYDVAGNLTSVIDPNGNVTTYAYDDLGRMLSQNSPVTGTTAYGYDLAGDLILTADANHATTTRTYDALGRVLTATSAISGSASETVTWGYDGSAGTFSIGRIASMTDSSGATNYRYERRGLLVNESRSSGSFVMATSFVYDANGNRTSLHYPSGLTIDYTYDFANRPLSLSSGGIGYVSGAKYLPFGPELSVDFANGTRQMRTYDARYRIQRNTLAFASGAPIVDYSYGEDAAGNITSIHDLVDPGYNRDFGYDDLNRLTVANTGAALWGTGSYRYDAMGNMLARDVGGVVEVDPNNPLLTRGRKYSAHADSLPAPGSVHETYTYAGATSKLATITSDGLDHPFTYDAAGNETRYFDDRTYSARNLMTSIAEPSEDGKPHTINYGYDGRGVRLIRSEGTSGYAAPFATRYYVYSPELQLLAVSDEGPNVWGKTAISNMAPPMKHEIVWFNGRPIAELLNQSIVRYTFTDHLGTPILQTDSNATVTWRAEYEPYGDIFLLRNGTTAAEQPLRFPGQEYERKWEGVEERYNIHRWYRSGWGRYTQFDPWGLGGNGVFIQQDSGGGVFVGANPKGWHYGDNPSGYGMENPLTNTDAYGAQTAAPPNAAAYVCCDGNGGFTVCWGQNIADPTLRTCLEAHELDHVDWLTRNPGRCGNQCYDASGQARPRGSNTWRMSAQDWHAMECRGYRAEVQCLRQHRNRHNRPQVDQRINQMINLGQQNHGCNTTGW